MSNPDQIRGALESNLGERKDGAYHIKLSDFKGLKGDTLIE
jgi:hypothetical protein